MRFAFVLILLLAGGAAVNRAVWAQENREFSPKERQADMGRLRDFFYPKGYSDETIIAFENGRIPENITAPEFARLHCGEAGHVILHPCLLRSRDGAGVDFFVIAHGGNRHFRELGLALRYYQERIAETVAQYEAEVAALNAYVEDFCAQIAAGGRARDILQAKGERPRIHHAIATPDPEAKYPFSNLFQWPKCLGCVGIVAVSQKPEDQPPVCGAVKKQPVPRVNYFVVNKLTSRGHGNLNDAMAEFARKAEVPPNSN